MLSNMLYEKRFGPYFCGPVVAGLNPDDTPYIVGTDSIGALETAKDFMVSGTAPESIIGVSESFWRPGMVRLAAADVLQCHVEFTTQQRSSVCL